MMKVTIIRQDASPIANPEMLMNEYPLYFQRFLKVILKKFWSIVIGGLLVFKRQVLLSKVATTLDYLINLIGYSGKAKELQEMMITNFPGQAIFLPKEII